MQLSQQLRWTMATKHVAKRLKSRKSVPKVPAPTKNKEHLKRVTVDKAVYDDPTWNVCSGELISTAKVKSGPKPAKVESLFRVVGEKLPFAALPAVRDHLKARGIAGRGVYIAHDSMGCPRYIGRGQIFSRLALRKKAQKLELEYFSFYLVADKKHEREVETLLIRAAGFLLEFNDRKKQVGHWPGNITDYEAGTDFYARRYKNRSKR